MADSLLVPLLLAALVANALAAGFFYAFACAVMPGLARVDDRTFVSTMVAVNAAVKNPLFALSFFGGVLLPAAALLAALLSGEGGTARWIGVAVALFMVQYLVTFSRNIPLNLRLARDVRGPHASTRRAFEKPWVRANGVRTVAATGSVLSLGLALLATV
ncbi:DUF1772 domain-containing protein [Rathayibacter rathayi]|uniref:DUF1772 domain-containing protein n=1 Tax=Rathayibacter rathayi TaxID=33887 RepID=A0ABX5A9C1_RATRA|nr:anthrone oxygenase family protein [Rathayibacter rathayi]MWV75809.1 DUF1772 domain-containing protein [Rathayibacter rathayi NCPPB 2980 = VKM Ac-1601]PPF21433.1 DUF1772 domain-containing protein [Rathayibacter rathayi]PPF45719.1 DUF1772 domain-containing protein [Rathayibacter rathayi]PPF78298.1 DUF1772 domain-containing protein [Rathayibacter rathayi]PPG11680.1 DUF1772 domain-containing protein [Rathayibacter rathayi]